MGEGGWRRQVSVAGIKAVFARLASELSLTVREANRRKYRFTALSAASLTFVALSLPVSIVPLFAQSLTKIRVANIGGTSDHIQIAVDAGIYKKYGFDVENIQVGSSA